MVAVQQIVSCTFKAYQHVTGCRFDLEDFQITRVLHQADIVGRIGGQNVICASTRINPQTGRIRSHVGCNKIDHTKRSIGIQTDRTAFDESIDARTVQDRTAIRTDDIFATITGKNLNQTVVV